MSKCLLDIFYRFSFAFEMLKFVAKYLLLPVILILSITNSTFASKNFSNHEENIFDNVSIESAFINEYILKPCAQNSEGTIDVEPTFIEEDENEDEDENISHKKIEIKSSSDFELTFIPSLLFSQGFFKKHYYSFLTQFHTSITGKYKVLEVFRL